MSDGRPHRSTGVLRPATDPATGLLTDVPSRIARVGLISVHTSPLDQPGTGDGGGLNVYVREVARRMGARGVEVDVFTRRTDPSQPDTLTIAPGVLLHHLDAGPAEPVAKEDLATLLCPFELALAAHPRLPGLEVLHAHYWLSGWVGRRVARRTGVPLVQTFHTLAALKNATLAPGDRPEGALRMVAEAEVARDADQVLVLTCGEARLFHSSFGLSGARLTVVPAGVDLDVFRPDAPDATDATDATDALDVSGMGSGDVELLFAGRLQPLKGPDVAVRTLAEVRRHRSDVRLRIVGGESGGTGVATSVASLTELARELGVIEHVVFEPALPQTELAARLRAADLVLVPSRSETFGLIALEAQACGTPVIAARVAGLEVVVGDGGMLVDGHEPADHAAAVLTLLDDPARMAAARAAGLEDAAASSWEHTVDRLLDAYAAVQHARMTRSTASDSASDPVSASAVGR
jgi:D-inositol-3-phosphate glycosyltransferase